ncbi:hypothetical protein [Rhizohabitans arisaemae]|uniref:hypothetical protein n=1 Tax=Rhizohabitans arisaemae TaxID=2720610 RepID=UPI0024B10A77|nr:hypothetical protein [Rhizohabitans arisaemae]
MIQRFAAIALLLLLVGCSRPADPGPPARPPGNAGAGPTVGISGTAPVTVTPATVVIRFSRCGNGDGCGGEYDRLTVGADGRAVTWRGRELVAVRLPAAELNGLRTDLVALLAGREGTIDRFTGSHEPAAEITVVNPDGKKVHRVRLNGTPTEQDKPIVTAVDRLRELTRRVRDTGEPDLTAPIAVRLYEDRNAIDELPKAQWPESVPDPGLPTDVPWVVEYRGQEATALREALGSAPQAAVRIGKRTWVVSWEASPPSEG